MAVKAWHYPDGSWSGHIVTVSGYGSDGSRRGARDDEERDDAAMPGRERDAAVEAAANHQRSVRRSRKLLVQLVRTYLLTRLLTFTNGGCDGGWSSGQAALDDFMRWVVHGGGRTLLCGGEALKLVAVAERGKDGRWHVHALIPSGGWLGYKAISRSWSAYLTNLGYVSAAASGIHIWHAGDERGRGGNGFSSARVAARYVSKYLTKGLDEECGTVAARHRFRAVGCDKPEPWLAFHVPNLLVALEQLGLTATTNGVYALKRTDETDEWTYGYLFDLNPVGG